MSDPLSPTPRILDLFCGAGGAGMGYHRAGFEVVGVDIEPQPNYPFEFHQADAMTYPLDGFDAIHASPPCQRWCDLAYRNGNAEEWPDLVGPIRERLDGWSWAKPHPYLGLVRRPWVIENVEGAPLVDPMMLCGTMFSGLRVLRHRHFESHAPLAPRKHRPHPLVFTYDKRKAHYGRLDQNVSFVQVTGGGNCTVANARDAMGIDWMTKNELNEAVPPAYTEWVGTQLLAHLQAEVPA